MRMQTFVTTFFALIGLTFSVSGAFAQSTALNTNVVSKKAPLRIPEESWSVPINFEMASTLHRPDAYERSAQEMLNIAPNYKISNHWSVGMLGTIYRDDSANEDGAGKTSIGNTMVSVAYQQPIAAKTVWKNTASGILPTDSTLRDETSYQGAVRGSSAFIFSGLWHGSSFVYNSTLTRNFHAYEITSAGSFNIRESLGQAFDYSLPLYKKLGAQTNLSYNMGRTYQNDLRTKFSFELNLTWDFTKNFMVAVGTSNEGNALNYNGQDSNIEFFNDNTSVVKVGVTYIF